MRHRLFATLGLLSGLGYIYAGSSAVVFAASIWAPRPSVLIAGAALLAASLASVVAHQLLVRRSLATMQEALWEAKDSSEALEDVAFDAIALLKREGRHSEAAAILHQTLTGKRTTRSH